MRRWSIKYLVVLFSSFFYAFLFVSCAVFLNRERNSLTDDDYYLYLRNDTSICELQALNVTKPFLSYLDTIIRVREKYPECWNDPHPYVYLIEETLRDNKLKYFIETTTSTQFIQEISLIGAFRFNEDIFIVLAKANGNTSFEFAQDSISVKVFFCDRIYHSRYHYEVRIDETNIKFDCVETEIIKIK